MNTLKAICLGIGGLGVAASMLTAQIAFGQVPSDHGRMGHTAAAPATPAAIAATPSVKAFVAAAEHMHHDMAITYSGNADVDFVKGMIPHHRGAVDMAKIVLEHGKDPAIKRLAREIIRSQNAEILMMKSWLAKNEKKK